MSGIVIEHLSKSFHTLKALDDISLTIEFGKIYALLGRNGAGKTTMLNLISNRVFADAGEILIENEPSTSENSQKKVYLTSTYTMYPENFKVMDVFYLTNLFYGTFDFEHAKELCRRFQLDTKKKVSALSTGYQAIYKLITGLCLDVPYIIFDEPVLGLDANHREIFYKELLKSYMEQNRTYIISTHLIDEIKDIAEEIIIINEGKLLENKSSEELLANGYCVSGKALDVDAFCKDKKVLGVDTLGGFKVAYIYGERPTMGPSQGLELGNINLQQLFVAMTAKEGENDEVI